MGTGTTPKLNTEAAGGCVGVCLVRHGRYHSSDLAAWAGRLPIMNLLSVDPPPCRLSVVAADALKVAGIALADFKSA